MRPDRLRQSGSSGRVRLRRPAKRLRPLPGRAEATGRTPPWADAG